MGPAVSGYVIVFEQGWARCSHSPWHYSIYAQTGQIQIYADTKNLWSGKNVGFVLNESPCLATTEAATNNCVKSFIFSLKSSFPSCCICAGTGLNVCCLGYCRFFRFCIIQLVFYFRWDTMQLVRSFSMYFDHHRNVRFKWFGRFHLHTRVREKVLKTTLLLTHCNSFLCVYFYDRLYIILLTAFLFV